MINFKDRVVSTPNRYRVSKISEDLVREKIEHFRKMGFTLFDPQ